MHLIALSLCFAFTTWLYYMADPLTTPRELYYAIKVMPLLIGCWWLEASFFHGIEKYGKLVASARHDRCDDCGSGGV